METLAVTALSLGVLATVALAAGALWLITRGGNPKKGALMLCAAAVLLGNVLIWTWPA
jgi:hypothetical protein